MRGIEIKVIQGMDARQYLNDIAEMRIVMFKEFPYLYDGSIEDERQYLEGYFKSETSTIILVFDGDEVVAFSSVISLADEMDEIKQPFIDKGLPLDEYAYIGEMMIKPEYRQQGLLYRLKEKQEAIIREHRYQNVIFMTVYRDQDHIARPHNYKDPAIVWRHFGYEILPNMRIEMPWQRVDTGKEEMNYLDVWYKKL